MPELPEVETVCRTLAPLVTGRSIVAVEFSWPRTLGSPDLNAFATGVLNVPIVSITRRAKYIVLNLASGEAIAVHLRMTGQLLHIATGSSLEPDPYARAGFLLDDGASLSFSDIRKFGRIRLLSVPELEAFSAALGVEPLSSTFTTRWLAESFSSKKRQIKPLLLDQTFIAGLGNIYVDESLHIAGIHPLTPANLITTDQVCRLHAAIVETLSGAISRQGTTLRNYRTGLGESGENQNFLRIYGAKAGKPCGRCGTPVKRLTVGQRGTVFCPTCQPHPTNQE